MNSSFPVIFHGFPERGSYIHPEEMDLAKKRRNGGPTRSVTVTVALAASLILPAGKPLSAATVEGELAAMAPQRLKKLSLEELMEIEVSLVSRKTEKLNQAPSAIQVITTEEIRRAGVATLPEALRLAANLQVARVNARDFAITARGLNQSLSNKLLVMIDGRTVYTPLFAGVFWDIQHLILDNIERIEVISGPGGTLWGSNAVNGIINIVTKDATATPGLFLEGGGGTFQRDFASARYGGHLGEAAHYRVYGQRLDQNSTVLEDGTDNHNGWGLTHGGIRADIRKGGRDHVSVTAEVLGGTWEQSPVRRATAPPRDQQDIDLNTQFLQARWQHTLSPRSDFRLKAYADRTYRNIPLSFEEDLLTLDADFQHHLALGERNNLIWGAGARMMRDQVTNGLTTIFLPADQDLFLYSAFLQDEATFRDGMVKVAAGVKVERNDYSGLEAMPSARASLSPSERHTLWTSVSRAIRSPSRIDVDFYYPNPATVPDTTPRIDGGPDFGSEELYAYELGWRTQPFPALSLSLSGFLHQYDRLRILETIDSVRYRFTNGLRGLLTGFEVAGNWQVATWWRLRAGYTFLASDLEPIPGHVEVVQVGSQGNDPGYQLVVHSFLDLPRGFEVNAGLRLIDELPKPHVERYASLDLGVAWRGKGLEVSVHGFDLLSEQHPEFGARESGTPPIRSRNEIPRSVRGRIAWHL